MQNCKEQAGVEISLDEWSIQSAVDLFFGEDLMKLFVTETNRYHEQQQIDIEGSKDRKWTDTDAEEMKKFLALIILMGLIKKSQRKMSKMVVKSAARWTVLREISYKIKILN